MQDLIDRHPTFSHQEFEKWIIQAQKSHELSGSFSWWIIAKRDQRIPLVFMPQRLFREIEYCLKGKLLTLIHLKTTIRNAAKKEKKTQLICTKLDELLSNLPPKEIGKLYL